MAGQVALTPGVSAMAPRLVWNGVPDYWGCHTYKTTQFVWLEGPTSAEFIFDIGDGQVTPGCVNWGVQQARQDIASILGNPDALNNVENAVIGASYYNTDPNCFNYQHPDHKAVYDAITTMNFGVPHQITATCGGTYGGGHSYGQITDANWLGNMQVSFAGGTGVAVGNMQRFYGWLFPGFLDYGPQTGYDLNGGPTVALQKFQTFAQVR